jgi:Zn-dependent metalloprotease
VALSSRAEPSSSLSLDSVAARVAVNKTLDFIRQQQPAGASRTLGATPDLGRDFTARDVTRDTLGMTHVRLDRKHEGVRVFGEQVIGHLDRGGQMKDLTGNVGAIPAGLGSAPVKVSAQEALALAQKDFAGATDRKPTAERVVYQDKDGQYRAAWHVQLDNVSNLRGEERPRRMNYLIDANSGGMLEKFNQMGGIELPHAKSSAGKPATTPPAPGQPTVPGTGTGNDTSLYSGKVELSTTKNADGTYSLEDSSRGKGVVTYDGQNKEEPSGKVPFKDANNAWGEAKDAARTKAAVDAHYGAQMTYDFYKDVLGRDSIDGKGEKLVSYVHVGSELVNAFWDGQKMSYGDGNGTDSGPLTTLDIAGHEITHGLTERTAGLLYRGESGGLNEAFSDILGTGVEWYASQKNPGVEFDWKMGEDAWTPANGPGDALRYMDDPTKDGYSVDHYSNYPKQTEVHGSSGIANNAFYLLANGGTNRTSGQKVEGGIGMEKGLKIFSRALTTYMTPNTNFAQARQATVKAATDLYGASSAEVQKVKDAWSAVGVR